MIVGGLLAGALALGLVLTSSTPGHAASKPSYCAASLAVDHYTGRSGVAVHALLDRVLTVAPVEVVSFVKTMRAAPVHSARYAAANVGWSRYNTNHCCTCIGGTSAPHVILTPIR
jgi:hypothetical protein